MFLISLAQRMLILQVDTYLLIVVRVNKYIINGTALEQWLLLIESGQGKKKRG